LFSDYAPSKYSAEWTYRQSLERVGVSYGLSGRKKLYTMSFIIIDLGENSRKIFEFKGLIRKIFRNKDLEWMLGLLTLAKY
jgi:hypothetical protein